MKKTGLCIAGICAFALGLSVAAIHAAPQNNADVSGTWTLSVTNTPAPVISGPGPDAARAAAAAAQAAAAGQGGAGGRGAGRGPAGPPTVTLMQTGSDVTGTLGGGRGPGVPLKGMVSGNTVTWTVARRLSDGIGRDATYKATVSGDAMTGTIAEPTVDPTQAYTDSFTGKRNAAQ